VIKGDLKGKKIKMKVDNQIVLAYINKITRKILLLVKIMRKIIEKIKKIELSMTTVYIPSKENKSQRDL
jgi:hypothetical protein